MATTYLRLFDPTQQFQLKNGAINTAGLLRVYLNNTADLADIYDENGTQLAQPAVLDNNGRALGLFVDSKKTYRLEVYDQFDSLLFTVRNMTPCGGGGGSSLGSQYEVTSSDGSIDVQKSVDAGKTTFDLTKPEDSTELLEWVRCDGGNDIPDSGIIRPLFTEGTMDIGDRGVELTEGRYYHMTAHVRATKDMQAQPWYDSVNVKFVGIDGEGNETDLVTTRHVVDYSLGLSQEFEVSTDILAPVDMQACVVIDGRSVQGGSFELIDLECHRVFSGAPVLPGGVLSRAAAYEAFQRKLIAGRNITITPTEEGDVISSTGGGGGGGGGDYQGGDGIIVNNLTYRISIDPTVVQEKLTAGDNIQIVGNTISATDTKYTAGPGISISDQNVISATGGSGTPVQADWLEDDPLEPSYIQHKPDMNQYATVIDLSQKADKVIGAVAGNLAGLDSTGNLTDSGVSSLNIVHDADYHHTDNNYTTTEKNKLAGIEAGAQVNVKPDWNAATGSPQEILHRPNLATVATSGDYNDLSNRPTIPAAQVNVDWNSTSGVTEILNKPNLAAVATSGDYNDLVNTPTIPVLPPRKTLVAGTNITITEGATTVEISSTGGGSGTQTNADWTESDPASPAYIEHKPNLATVATSGSYNDLSNRPSLAAVATSGNYGDLSNRPSLAAVATSGNYNDLSNKPSIPAAQVNVDWNSTSGVTEILNKPNLASVSTSGDYADLTNKPVFGTIQVV